MFSRALKWSFLAELSSKAIQPVIFIALARLLTPEDFGVMAVALMVVAFSQIFWEAGMGKALIQRQTDVSDAANGAFWINVVLGLVVAAAVIAFSEPIAQVLFQEDRVTPVLRVMSIHVALGALGSVHTALLQKEMDFKPLFWIRFASTLFSGLVSIVLAVAGMSYWALVWGTLAGQALQTIMLWRTSGWRPAWSFSTPVAGQIARFGGWVFVSGILGWFYLWADALIVGAYLGNHQLGLYRTGNHFTMMVFNLVFLPVLPVLYSHLVKSQSDLASLGHIMGQVVRALVLVAIPLGVIIFTVSEPLGALLFGPQWQGIGFVIGIMALTYGISWVAGMNGEAYRAMGRPALETALRALMLVVYLPAYIVSINYGFEAFVWTRFGLAVVATALHLLLLVKVLPIPALPVTRALVLIPLVSVGVTLAASKLLNGYFTSAWGQVLVIGGVNLLLVALILFYLERNRSVTDLGLLFRGEK